MSEQTSNIKAMTGEPLVAVVALAKSIKSMPEGGIDCERAIADVNALDLPASLKGALARVMRRQTEPYRENSEEKRARGLQGAALAEAFMDGANPLPIFEAVRLWDAFAGYEARLRDLVAEEAGARLFCERFKPIIREREENPRLYSRFSSEAAEYGEQVDLWREEKDLERLLSQRGFYIGGWLPGADSLRALLPANPGALASLLCGISAPDVLLDAIWSAAPGESGPELLAEAPVCEEAGQWNGNPLAPFILEWAVRYAEKRLELSRGINRDFHPDALAAMKNFWAKMADALMARPDGAWLGLTFLVILSGRDFGAGDSPERVAADMAIEAISRRLRNLCELPLSRLYEELCGISYDDAEKAATRFRETGILAKATGGARLASVLALASTANPRDIIQAQKCLEVFRHVICFAEAGLYTSEYKQFPDRRHERIGATIAACIDPFATWQSLWEELSGAANRLAYAPFGLQSNDLRYVRNFILVSGICACKALGQAGADLAEAIGAKIADLPRMGDFEEKFLEGATILLNDTCAAATG